MATNEHFDNTLYQESKDVSERNVDDIWAEEAEKRLEAYRDGRLAGVPIEEVFKK